MKSAPDRYTIKINMAQLETWLAECWKQCWADVKAELVRQDYLTATDLQAAIRLRADRTVEPDTRKGWAKEFKSADWWGYDSSFVGSRLVIVDKPFNYDLLGLIRTWLGQQVRDGEIVAHNFGRGHCSGMRFRAATEAILSNKEEKTIKRNESPKAVHFADPASKGYHDRKSYCTAKQRATNLKKGGFSFGRSRNRPTTRITTKESEVTCPRCKKLLKEKEAKAV